MLGLNVEFIMLKCEALLLSTQSVISLSLKLKRKLNLLLPARYGLRDLAFEYPIRDFLRLNSMLNDVGFSSFFTQFRRAFE